MLSLKLAHNVTITIAAPSWPIKAGIVTSEVRGIGHRTHCHCQLFNEAECDFDTSSSLTALERQQKIYSQTIKCNVAIGKSQIKY